MSLISLLLDTESSRSRWARVASAFILNLTLCTWTADACGSGSRVGRCEPATGFSAIFASFASSSCCSSDTDFSQTLLRGGAPP